MTDLKIGCRYKWRSLTSSAIILPSIDVEVWAQNAQMEALITWDNFSLGVTMAKWVPVTELEPRDD